MKSSQQAECQQKKLYSLQALLLKILGSGDKKHRLLTLEEGGSYATVYSRVGNERAC